MTRKIFTDIKIKKEIQRVIIKPVAPLFVEDKIKINSEDREQIKKELNYKNIIEGSNLPKNKKRIKWSKIIFIIFFISILALIFYWGSSFFEQVNINITKKHQIFNLEQEVFEANKGLESALPFEIMIVSDQKMEKIMLSKNNEVSLKAKGEVALYNEYSKEALKLASNTYLSDENGKVYLTDKAIAIPGFTSKDDKIIPGEIKVSVTSFLPGKAYNGSPTQFTVNSYKGTPKFNKIYGKATTSFSGGASGLNYSLEEKDIEILKNLANSSLKESLIKKVDSLIPKEYVFYPDAYSYSYTIDENTLSETIEAEVLITGTLHVVLLKQDKLIESVIKNLLPKISPNELKTININGMEKLVFNFTSGQEVISKELQQASFSLRGELDFIWNPNIEELKNKLLGSPKENLSLIFKNDVGIENASTKMFPPWLKTLPNDPSKIKITIF